jgi:hypothetical protein
VNFSSLSQRFYVIAIYIANITNNIFNYDRFPNRKPFTSWSEAIWISQAGKKFGPRSHAPLRRQENIKFGKCDEKEKALTYRLVLIQQFC